MTDTLIDPTPSLLGRAGRWCLQRLGLHPEDPEETVILLPDARALCIATNHGVLATGVPTGVFASELTVPYYLFQDAGMRVDLASPLGGVVPVEPLSVKEWLRTPADDRMLGDPALRQQLMNSLAVADVDFTAYDLIYFAGGWGAAFDLGRSEILGARLSEAVAAGRVIGGICHGPLGLLRARRPDGHPFVEGRRLTAVTDRQVRQLGVTITPMHPESVLREAGALFESRTNRFADFFANHWVEDGDLITGQNQNAGPMVARLMLQRVRANRARR